MPSRSESSSDVRVLVWIVGAAVAYAAVRYCVFGNVGWNEFPLYVLNKGVAAGALALIALAYLANRSMPPDPAGRARRRRLARHAGLAGFWLALVHSAVSLPILTAAHYPTLFDQSGLSRTGVTCLILGAGALGFFAVPAFFSTAAGSREGRSDIWRRAQQFGYLGLGVTAAHAAVLGYGRWSEVAAWPGGLPPISLLSFAGCAVPIAFKLASVYRRRRHARQTDLAPS